MGESSHGSSPSPEGGGTTSKSTFSKGEVIGGRYEVKEKLGRGGMGVVYLAHDRKTGQRVALKTLLPQYVSNKQAVNRFVREFNAIKQLDHPGIVKVYDAWKMDRLLMYTMEYVEGHSLRQLMNQRGKLGLGSTVRVLSLLCHALEHAHKFTIHRDLSPENVIVIADGQIKLLDFGLAKLLDADAALTRIGVSLGKMQYMAPEQRLNARDVDKRADVYSLGVMFFELLTGHIPKPNERLTNLRPDLPEDCDDLVDMALAPQAAMRLGSAREFQEALINIYNTHKAAGAPTGAPQDSAATPRATPTYTLKQPWWKRLLRFLRLKR
jgi:serine/threonine protein kinase